MLSPEVAAGLMAAANEMFGAGCRLPRDIEVGDFDVLMAITNRMGKVVAMMRAALETVPEDQRS